MCGRFAFYASPGEIKHTFELDASPDTEQSWNINPGEEIATVGENPDTGDRSLAHLKWGLVPFWADSPDSFSGNLINARAETVTEKSSFKRSFRNRRCIIPANGFYEWKQQADEKKRPYFIKSKSDDLLGLAGIWDRWSNDRSGEALNSVSIITTDANKQLDSVHHRMPVILDENEYDDWLDPDTTDNARLTTMLNSYPASKLAWHPVDQRVNSPENDDPECVEPLEDV